MQLPIIIPQDEAFSSFSLGNLPPSSFYWTTEGCAFQTVLSQCMKKKKGMLLPPPFAAKWGTISHSLCEFVVKNPDVSIGDLVKKCTELVQEQETELKEDYPLLQNVSLMDNNRRNTAIIAANNLISKRAETSPDKAKAKQSYVEKYIGCDELHLGGYIDRVIIKDNLVHIIDYKFGEIYNESNEIKEEYCLQLRLYAMMYEKVHEQYRVERLVLITSDGVHHEIPFERESWDDIQNSVKDTYNKISNLVSKKEWDGLAKPNVDTCGFCSCRHFCKYAELRDDDVFCIKRGVLNEIRLGNVMCLTSSDNEKFTVYGLKSYSIDNVEDYIGKQIVFANITSLSDTPHSYRLNSNSLIYENRW